jgi:hypothetical protein
MGPTVAAVLGKGRAFVEGLTRLPRGARAAAPHGHFARDYNTLRKLALEVAPGLDERLLGKYIGVSSTPGGEFSQASYVEIEVYARQIVEQLTLLVGSRATGPAGAARPEESVAATAKAYNVAAIRKEYNQAYAPWSEEDDGYLRSRFLEGATIEDLVMEFGREPGGIRSRLRKLGLAVPGNTSVPGAQNSQDEGRRSVAGGSGVPLNAEQSGSRPPVAAGVCSLSAAGPCTADPEGGSPNPDAAVCTIASAALRPTEQSGLSSEGLADGR